MIFGNGMWLALTAFDVGFSLRRLTDHSCKAPLEFEWGTVGPMLGWCFQQRTKVGVGVDVLILASRFERKMCNAFTNEPLKQKKHWHPYVYMLEYTVQ